MKNKIKVAISEFPPLIIDNHGKYSGFEIELWEMIAKEAKLKFEYKKYNFPEIIPLIAKKKVDIVLAGITINEKREKIIDFSHATLNSGLLILTSASRDRVSIKNTLKSFLGASKRLLGPLLLIILFVFFFGHLFWFFEKDAGTFTRGYYPGIIQSFWLVICNMTTDSFGDFIPHTAAGRVIIIFELFTGIAIFGLMIGEVTAFISEKKVRSLIEDPADLAQKTVATVRDTTSLKTLTKLGAKVIPVEKIEEAYKKLEENKVDAIVYDAPAVIHYTENEGKGKFNVVGTVFEKQNYGVALQSGSPLRDKINQVILKLRESGYYDLLYKKWFGEETDME
jgi:polar amino acid transport system substrate-binding protein